MSLPWDVPAEPTTPQPAQVEPAQFEIEDAAFSPRADEPSTEVTDDLQRIEGWHPRITPYRLLVTALTIGLGTAKAVASTSEGGSATSVTIEWITGIVVLLLTFFLTRYETKDGAKPQWLFKLDVLDGIRALGLRIPVYDTDERPIDLLVKPRHPSITGYRILVSASAISFGITKALLSYKGLDAAPTTIEWVYGVLITVSLYWLGMYESSSSEVMPWLFATDYSKEVYSLSFAIGFVALHIGALYVTHYWTHIWYMGVKDMMSDWTTDPGTSAFDAFFNNLFALLWLVMAVLMGIGSGVVGTLAVIASLARLLIPWMIKAVRTCLRAVRSRFGRRTDEWGDEEATLVDFGEFTRTKRWLRSINWPSIQFSPAQNEVWRKIFTALSYIAVAAVYTLAHAVAFIVTFGWTSLWFYGLRALWTQGSSGEVLVLLSTPLPRPANAIPVIRRQGGSVTALSTSDIAAFRPFTSYASSAYCKAEKLRTWQCGKNCLANPTFQPIAAGGDGNDIQFWFVGIDPTLKTVVVGHQGTDPSKIMSILTDIDFLLDELDSKLFPGLPKGIKVHNGFGKAHAETATDVLAAVKTALSESGLKQVTVVGHSLGGAIALLNGIFLPLKLPGVSVRTITYGMPRVGNKALAQYVDANVRIDRVINQDDIVPILPGRFLGFRHPGGEKHIQDDLSWVSCPGGDNTDKRCSVGDVKNIFDASVKEHSGPYDTIKMGC